MIDVKPVDALALLSWLGAKPREATFNYNSPHSCAVSKYFNELNPGVQDGAAWTESVDWYDPSMGGKRYTAPLDQRIHLAMVKAAGYATNEDWQEAGNPTMISYGAAHDELAALLAL